MPDTWWDWNKLEHFRRLQRYAEDFDKATDQPNCEDPEKVALLKRIEDRLTAIENKLEGK